ncbi:MAG: sensor histidine kinase [Sphingomonas sp.]
MASDADRAGPDRYRSGMAPIVTPLLIFLLGAAALAAGEHGLFATFALTLLLAVWLAATNLVSARRRAALPAAPVPLWTAERAREQRRLTAYLDLSPAPLVTLDGEDRLFAVNRAARRLFGCEDRVPGPPAGLIAAIAGAAPGRSASVQIELDGEPRDFALAIADLAQAGASLRIAALVDIGAELRAAEASALRDLLQVLSHEIMNALTPIASLGRSAADLLADRQDATLADVQDAVETVARRAEGLQRFTTAYRDLARLPPPSIARVAIVPLIDDLARMAAVRWPALTLTTDVERAPRTMDADPDQLHAALWALVQNAAEAVGEGHVTVAVAAVSGGVLFTVSDDGPGIAPAHFDAVFRPFFTTKPEGSGVGLTLVRQIVHAHQGVTRVESRPGRTTFAIELPVR